MPTYYPKTIEAKWQQYWDDHQTFQAGDADDRPKFYALDMFPYPSGDGLHVGHPEGYTATDIVCRYKRMVGFNVLHPMGWDAFGLPAEQYAVENNVHPRITTEKNINNFRRQIKMLGFSYDWSREVNTTDPKYYKWTQWIFSQLFQHYYDQENQQARPIEELEIPDAIQSQGENAIADYRDQHRLAYLAEVPVNWCPFLGTVLANEEVVDGVSERGGHPVVRKPMRQWMLRITQYADRLIDDLIPLDWPEAIKQMQRNWIGKSTGAEVDFFVVPPDDDGTIASEWLADRHAAGTPDSTEDNVIRVYTTRPDTLFGATYMVLAPEHPLVDKIASPEQMDQINNYRQQAASKSDLDRTELSKSKTGVFTGGFALNPVDASLIPIWIADYVLMSYGTGAIMAVPAHDERDYEFAQQFNLEIADVVMPEDELPPILRQAYEWLGDWARNNDWQPGEPSLKVILVLNCGVDIENFQDDKTTNQHDPMWNDVEMFVDESTGHGAAIKFSDPDFYETLLEYLDQTEDTEILAFTLDDDDVEEEDNDTDEFDDDDSVEEVDPDTLEAQDDQDDDDIGAFSGEGISINSGFITGLPTAEAKNYMIDWLEQNGVGRASVQYKLRDWLFSRQRYWGEPFPIVLDDQDRPYAVPTADLPVTLPEVEDFKPTGTPDPPLSKATDWVQNVTGPDNKNYQREVNTMPQWAGSCWYYLRYIDPTNDTEAWDTAKENYWMPVDLYVGGAEHAVLHLLYARFWHKFLYDIGKVSTPEPFQKLVNQGMILGEAEYTGYKKADEWISASKVKENDDKIPVDKKTGQPVDKVPLTEEELQKKGQEWFLDQNPSIKIDARAHKMSKSRGNVVNPDDVVNQYSADALRLYEMFMGPLEATKPWNMQNVEGIWRFLNRAWRVVVDVNAEDLQLQSTIVDADPNADQWRMLHITIRGVTQDLNELRFNTGISKLMEFSNFLTSLDKQPRALIEPFVLMLSPFAPHLGEELWQALGHDNTLAYEPWPKYDEALCKADHVEVAVQINNKVKSKVTVDADISDDELISIARADQKMVELMQGKQIVKSFVVNSRKGKLVNFVVKG